jgi:hypothetical protein
MVKVDIKNQNHKYLEMDGVFGLALEAKCRNPSFACESSRAKDSSDVDERICRKRRK